MDTATRSSLGEACSATRLPTVSVVVATFNRARYLRECLDSLLGQTVAPTQLVVVDDGSEDGTGDLVSRYGSRIEYIRKSNGGKPSAVNLALTRCTGEWVWLFDDDDVALPTAIEERLKALEGNDADAGFVYSAHHLGTDGANGTIQMGKLHVPPNPSAEAFFFELMRSCFFHLNSALVRRDLYKHVGEFDATLKAGEDYDMQIRLARVGKPVFCSAPTFVFRQHGGARGEKGQQYGETERSATFRRYSAAIGRKLRASTDPGDYLVPRVHAALHAGQLRQALLNRVHVMANHGCIAEVFDDLTAFLKLGTPVLTQGEADEIRLAMRNGWAYDACLDDWTDFKRRVRALRGAAGGPDVVAALAASLWLRARSYPGRWQDRLRTAARAGLLAAGAWRKPS